MTTRTKIEQLRIVYLERAMIAAEAVDRVSTAIECRLSELPDNPERLRAWLMVLIDEMEQIGVHLATADAFESAVTCG